MRRVDWFIGLGLFLLLLAVAIMAFFFWQQSRLDLTLTPVANVPLGVADGGNNTAVGETALTAFGRAQNRALTWQSDAALVSASATWPIISNLEVLLEGRENWTLTFYSPSQQAAVSISVVNETAAMGAPYAVPNPVQPLGPEGLRINSDTAVQTFLNNGGTQFFQTEAYTTFFMHLNAVNANGRLEWTMAAVSQQTGKSLTMILDATTGDILDIQIP
ncbi:MAG: hypothetical protein OT477_04510 [Chloroflexi bacterium]|nr:hypothetical protein [Chloroflexota bacterium]